jgi:hypothetical protein
MATKARHDVAGMHGKLIGASGGILALTPGEVAKFIDARVRSKGISGLTTSTTSIS